ncbi:hypothetical protein ADN00_05990 [Ornatilinea apprima]|uniref:Lipoprotein n=1 Tax=Ornatilinea apprima TaxID=1134406 RepID=A0A0P6XPY4_9CHLR|nr:hypothetical protein [Ornatilinea apprima]KPL78781.1 hypothetical protein ADN00_05990 [Ornatilinea apprima]
MKSLKISLLVTIIVSLSVLLAACDIRLTATPDTVSASENGGNGGNADAGEIAFLEEQLSNPELDEQTRASLQEKLDMAIRIATLQAATPVPGAQVQALDAVGGEGEEIPFNSGIFPGDEGLFKPSQALIENYWQEKVGEEYVQVFAGASGENPQQGLVIVVVTQADLVNSTTDFYPAAEASGSLHITEATPELVRMENQDGQAFCFKLAEGSFGCP